MNTLYRGQRYYFSSFDELWQFYLQKLVSHSNTHQ